MPQVPYASAAEWWGLCALVNHTCCLSIAQEVASVKLRSSFHRTLLWTDYDALMLGRFDGSRLFVGCFESMLKCTRDLSVGWCRKIANQVTHAAIIALHMFLAEKAPHFCTARTTCLCTDELTREMQAHVSSVLARIAFQRLMTKSFVYTDAQILGPRCMLAAIRSAVWMGQHPRLGIASPLMLLDRDILHQITTMCGIEPHSRKAAQHGHVPVPPAGA